MLIRKQKYFILALLLLSIGVDYISAQATSTSTNSATTNTATTNTATTNTATTNTATTNAATTNTATTNTATTNTGTTNTGTTSTGNTSTATTKAATTVTATILSTTTAEESTFGGAKVSWIYRGTAQTNNSVISLNKGDTLYLACKAETVSDKGAFAFVVTKGSKPPTNITVSTTGNKTDLKVTSEGTIIYTDAQDVMPGYENFVIIRPFSALTLALGTEYLSLGVGLLNQADAGTYHCSVLSYFWSTMHTSGGLTINVFTKPGQGLASQTNVNKLMTYSAIMFGASKLYF